MPGGRARAACSRALSGGNSRVEPRRAKAGSTVQEVDQWTTCVCKADAERFMMLNSPSASLKGATVGSAIQ